MPPAVVAMLAAMVAVGPTAAVPPVMPGMKSIGTAIKSSKLLGGVEKTVFEHNLSATATHGAITQQWHAGKPSGVTPNLRVRMYIDGESVASIDYPLFLAHGTGPAQTRLAPLEPWASATFGRTHDSGWYNSYLVPFGKSIRITLTDATASHFWYMCRGFENGALQLAGMALPSTTRLRLVRTTEPAVPHGSLVTFANLTGASGMLHQLNLVVNSSSYAYQEGCVSARIDGDNPLWLSSGLEDYFLGAYFHSMPVVHLPYSGFQLNATADKEQVPTNSLAAYRIHERDPVVFARSLAFHWIASSDNAAFDGGWCNFHWPETPMPLTPPAPNSSNSPISVDALAWVYVW